MPEENNLARALLAFQREGRTGVVDVRADDTRTIVYLADGVPVFAELGTLADRFGRLLVRQGLLSAEEHARVVDRMASGDLRRFGEIAVELGFLTAEEVQKALAAQVRIKVVSCLLWEKPAYSFDPDHERVRGMPHFPARIEPLVLVAARLVEPWRLADLLASASGKYLALHGYAEAIADRFQLGALGTAFLRRVDGSRSLEELMATYEGADAQPILSALLLAGELALNDTARFDSLVPPASKLPAPRPSRRVLLPRVPRTAAATSLARRRRAIAVLHRLEASLSAPTVPPPGAEPKPGDARAVGLAAERLFLAGKVHLRANRFARATGDLRRAAELLPDAREYALYAAWAELRTTSDEAKVAERRAALKDVAMRAKREDPKLALSHYVFGYLARISGDIVLAESFFRHAQRLDPVTLDAERHVRVWLRARAAKIASPAALPRKPPPVPKRAKKLPVPAALTARPAPDPPSTASLPAFAPVEARSTPDATELVAEEEVGRTMLPRRRTETRDLAIGFVLGAGVCAALILARTALSPHAAVEPIVIPVPTPVPTPTPTPVPTPSPSPTLSPSPTPSPTGEGEILPPASAKGHRVFVDGKVAGEGTDPLRVPCGEHTVKIGSAGTERTVNVPCGGAVQVEP